MGSFGSSSWRANVRDSGGLASKRVTGLDIARRVVNVTSLGYVEGAIDVVGRWGEKGRRGRERRREKVEEERERAV